MDDQDKHPHRPNRLLAFLWDLLAFMGGAGVVLVILRWLKGVVPLFDRFGWP